MGDRGHAKRENHALDFHASLTLVPLVTVSATGLGRYALMRVTYVLSPVINQTLLEIHEPCSDYFEEKNYHHTPT